jgi:hypothetical protein
LGRRGDYNERENKKNPGWQNNTEELKRTDQVAVKKEPRKNEQETAKETAIGQ